MAGTMKLFTYRRQDENLRRTLKQSQHRPSVSGLRLLPESIPFTSLLSEYLCKPCRRAKRGKGIAGYSGLLGHKKPPFGCSKRRRKPWRGNRAALHSPVRMGAQQRGTCHGRCDGSDSDVWAASTTVSVHAIHLSICVNNKTPATARP